MLNQPYELILKKDQNRYYYLNLSDYNQTFLAVESVEMLDQTTKRFLRKPKVEQVELTQNLKILPLTSVVVYLMSQFLETINVRKTVDKDGMEVEELHNVWDEFDILDLQNTFAEIVKRAGGSNNWHMPKTFKNPVAKAFDKDGYHFFGIDHVSSLMRNHWLVRTTPQGNIVIVIVKETGFYGKSTITVGVDTFIFNKELCNKIISDYNEIDIVIPDEEVSKNK
jgi:hypothetical protein